MPKGTPLWIPQDQNREVKATSEAIRWQRRSIVTRDKQEKREIFSIRLSPAERKNISAKADTAGMKLGEYIRATALKKKIPPSVPKVNRETYIELIRIGNNINQLAKAANIGIKRGDQLNLELNRLSELSQHLDRLKLEVLAVTEPEENDRQTD